MADYTTGRKTGNSNWIFIVGGIVGIVVLVALFAGIGDGSRLPTIDDPAVQTPALDAPVVDPTVPVE